MDASFPIFWVGSVCKTAFPPWRGRRNETGVASHVIQYFVSLCLQCHDPRVYMRSLQYLPIAPDTDNKSFSCLEAHTLFSPTVKNRRKGEF